MRSLILILFVVFSSACGATREMAVRSLISPMRLPLLGSPQAPHRDITFTTTDGLKLEGWLFEPQRPSLGLVVLLHGKDANRGHFAEDVELKDDLKNGVVQNFRARLKDNSVFAAREGVAPCDTP